jgi:hypothetical protein
MSMEGALCLVELPGDSELQILPQLKDLLPSGRKRGPLGTERNNALLGPERVWTHFAGSNPWHRSCEASPVDEVPKRTLPNSFRVHSSPDPSRRRKPVAAGEN